MSCKGKHRTDFDLTEYVRHDICGVLENSHIDFAMADLAFLLISRLS